MTRNLTLKVGGKKPKPMSLKPQKPRTYDTEKEIKERIAELEYVRIILPKIPHPRVMLRWESLTNEINRLYTKLKCVKSPTCPSKKK